MNKYESHEHTQRNIDWVDNDRPILPYTLLYERR